MAAFKKTKTSDNCDPEDVLQLPDLKILMWLLTPGSLWPLEPKSKVLRWVKFINKIWAYFWACATFFLGLDNLLRYRAEIPPHMIGHRIIVVASMEVYSVSSMIAWRDRYRIFTKHYLQNFHMINHRKTFDFSEKIYLKYNKKSSFLAKFSLATAFNNFFFITVLPVIRSLMSGAVTSAVRKARGLQNESIPLQTDLYATLPFDYYYDIKGWIIMTLFNVYYSTLHISAFNAWFLFKGLILLQIFAHYDIMVDSLKVLSKPSNSQTMRMSSNRFTAQENFEMYSREENQVVQKKLVEIVTQHQEVKRVLADFLEIFGTSMLNHLAHFIINLPSVAIQLSNLGMSALTLYLPLIAYTIFNLTVITSFGEKLTTKGQSFQAAVYAVPWECMDVRNRRTLLFLLLNSQRLPHFMPKGLLRIGMPLALNIIKTSFSYFRIMRANIKDKGSGS